MYEDDIQNLKKIINELNYKINLNNQKDKEIINLKNIVNDLKKEYSKLNESYENVLGDLQFNIKTNEKLRLLITDLENKIENHNNNVSGMDLLIKQQIENLTRNSLGKKNIEYKTSKDIVTKAKNDHIDLNNKIDKYNLQKLSYSQVLPRFNNMDSSVILSKNSNNSVINNNLNNITGNNSYVEIAGVQKLDENRGNIQTETLPSTTVIRNNNGVHYSDPKNKNITVINNNKK